MGGSEKTVVGKEEDGWGGQKRQLWVKRRMGGGIRKDSCG